MLRIKEILRERGVTITKLAEMVGLTQANMSLIVNEKSNPQLKTLERVAVALEISVPELFSEAGSGDTYGIVVYKGLSHRINSPEDLKRVFSLMEADGHYSV